MYPTVSRKATPWWKEKKKQSRSECQRQGLFIRNTRAPRTPSLTSNRFGQRKKDDSLWGLRAGNRKRKQYSVNREPKIFHSWDVERMRLLWNAFSHETDGNFRVRAAATLYVKFEYLDVVDDGRSETQRNVYNIYIYSSQWKLASSKNTIRENWFHFTYCAGLGLTMFIRLENAFADAQYTRILSIPIVFSSLTNFTKW